ncbi:hypothetical protein Pla123a_31560 [Posidoniimonas polymericola]|uniref:mannan endo-1,4-beta-mannosidase n=1 Tax=Posidoniimonas polymericola TaxID=2528002 RepID=A0A5C5YLA8_9BACT|nr:cellulase family glycosylhydrolase [Posidoniimonas polymericola]TWT75646.1 hypothetical protein Pla123a_31560 [Posidoniimonas polymericola]
MRIKVQRELLLALSACLLALGDSRAVAFEHFVTRQQHRLYDGDSPYRFVSWNVPNLHCVEDSLNFLGGSPWRWPDEFEVRDALRSVSQMGGRAARSYVISVRRDQGDMGDHVHVLGPGRFNEQAFQALDLVIKVAEEEGVRLIIPLVDNWHWWGGVKQYEAFRGRPEGAFWSDPQLVEDFKQTVRHVVQRRNTLTGERYSDSQAILAWETGNELDATAEWTRKVAAYIKQLDPNHLVIDGCSLHGPPLQSIDDPGIDIVTTHHYPNVGNNNAASVVEAAHQVAGRKAYLVGEFGFLPVDEARRVLDAVIESEAVGALYWSLRFHRREGGFYWHDEPSGQGVFKAFHWPGFTSGDGYREREVFQMVRGAAYRIRGEQPPTLPVPVPPKLLPCPRPLTLSWQGSAGASGYDVYRGLSAAGPWERIAERVSDARYPYQPLLADEEAEVGTQAYYRVVARNAAGDSTPSNVLGPIEVASRLLVDEFSEPRPERALQGAHEQTSARARQALEDFHRLLLQPGASVTYHVAGNIANVMVWAFSSAPNDELTVELSADGVHFTAAEVALKQADRGASDYAYLVPQLVEAAVSAPGWKYVRVSVAAGGSETELSRVEVRYLPE